MNPPIVALLVALQFLTRFPMPSPPSSETEDFARATLAFPVVGLLIGLFLFLIQWLCEGLPFMVQAALVLLAWVWITGNLHLDGLADTADAWVGGHGNRERTLEIMKDPNSGPSAVSAVVLVLLIKFAAVVAILEINPWLLILAPLIARTLLLPWFVLSPYVSGEGLATVFVRGLNPTHAWISCGASALFVLMFFGFSSIFVMLLATGFMFAWRYFGQQRIGGFTGDTSGAMIEMIEALVLVLVLVFSVY